jgi:hypothetical protein
MYFRAKWKQWDFALLCSWTDVNIVICWTTMIVPGFTAPSDEVISHWLT